MNCPLCLSKEIDVFFQREDVRYGKREYWSCFECGLVFLSSEHHFSFQQEKARYDLHENNPEDPGYREFLKKLSDPLCVKLKLGDEGLDFGCGPGPAMSSIFKEKGYSVKNYDPIYFPDPSLLKKQYDFITCTETIEHFYQPRKEFQLLAQLLKRGGVLALMTEVLDDPAQFSTWWYANDPTHVCFYQKKTFDWIAAWQNWTVQFPLKNVILYSWIPEVTV